MDGEWSSVVRCHRPPVELSAKECGGNGQLYVRCIWDCSWSSMTAHIVGQLITLPTLRDSSLPAPDGHRSSRHNTTAPNLRHIQLNLKTEKLSSIWTGELAGLDNTTRSDTTQLTTSLSGSNGAGPGENVAATELLSCGWAVSSSILFSGE